MKKTLKYKTELVELERPIDLPQTYVGDSIISNPINNFKITNIDSVGKLKQLLTELATIYFDISGKKMMWEEQAHEMIRKGELLQAVKYVKEHTGWGLKESKDWVDKVKMLIKPF